MPQDDLNQPTVTEEQPSDQPCAECVARAQAQPIAESPTLEPVTDDALDDGVPSDDDDDDAADAPLDETAETGSAAASNATDAASSMASPSAQSTTAADNRCAIAKQPYDFDHCTVQIALQPLPDDGDANGRMVVVGVRSHLDAPILRLTRWNELGALPPLVVTLLDELKAELPKREQAARQAIEKKQSEQAQRQSSATAAKTARGKKGKATQLPASTVSNATTPDNRPRPEVQVTTAPQQQRGLF